MPEVCMETEDLYATWLGVAPGTRPPDHYAILGLPLFCDDMQAIEQAARTRLAKLDNYAIHPDTQRRDACHRMMNEVARARVVLATSARKSAYDQQLAIQQGVVGPPELPVEEMADSEQSLFDDTGTDAEAEAYLYEIAAAARTAHRSRWASAVARQRRRTRQWKIAGYLVACAIVVAAIWWVVHSQSQVGDRSSRTEKSDSGQSSTTPSPTEDREQPTTVTIWDDSVTPSSAGDGSIGPARDQFHGLELGCHFTSDVSGYIVGVRFWKLPGDQSHIHTGELWDGNGNRLATAEFTDETASRWQHVNFRTPILIKPSATYTVSYHTTYGVFAYTERGLARGMDKPLLHALARRNGVYDYDHKPGLHFPYSYNGVAPNYWVDVIFRPNTTSRGPASAPQDGDKIDLLNLIDPTSDALSGLWKISDGALVSDGTAGARIEIPFEPPAEYDFQVEFTRTVDAEAVVQIGTHGGRPFNWCAGAFGNTTCAFLGGPWIGRPGGGKWLRAGQRHVMLVQVRDNSVRGYLDGKLLSTCDYGRLADQYWRVPNVRRLGLGNNGATVYHAIALIPATTGAQPPRAVPHLVKPAPLFDPDTAR